MTDQACNCSINCKPNIFITNDDGIDSPGIQALVDKMKELGNVFVVAPDRQQSAVSSAITMSAPLRVKEYFRDGQLFGYAVNGTPADCSKLALSELMQATPDLVISGINHGQNNAINVLYSGTLAGAMEGLLRGIPSIAVSMYSHDISADCTAAADYTYKIAKGILDNPLPKNTLLNVNIPNLSKDKIKGIKITKQSDAIWKDAYEKRNDPFDRDYYWFAGQYLIRNREENTDDTAIEEGYVSVTPLKIEFTDHELIDQLSNMNFD